MHARSAHHFVEFLETITEEDEEERAIQRAVELCTESIGTEVGAAIVDGSLRATVGFGNAPVPAAVIESLPLGTSALRLGGLGECHVAVVEMLRPEDRLLVARIGGEVGPRERSLLGGMGRVLGLALRTLRTLANERDLRSAQEQLAEERLVSVRSLQSRQQLLETLLALQRSISHRAPLSEILAAATFGARRLLSKPVWLYVDARPGRSHGANGAKTGFQLFGPAGPGRTAALEVAQAAVLAELPLNGTSGRPVQTPVAAEHAVSTVHVGGAVTGALVVEVGPGGALDHHGHRLLVTFAEHVSMALTDARTVAAVDEAFHDPLTDLPNRALFLDRVERALTRRRPERGEDVAVLFIDLDRFKAINDSLGHAAGDELLRQVAARLASCLRHGSVAGRFGGDEFAVLLERVSRAEEAEALAERLIERLREPFSLEGTRTAVVGASIGIALAGEKVDGAQNLLRDADLAMYRAKKQGGKSWALFAQQMYVEVRDRVELEADLQGALARCQLRVEYEPLFRLEDETVIGARPTIHWDHPQRGRLSPEVFMPLAEETGVIVDIGRFIIAEALEELAAWREVLPELILLLRVSARQLHEPAFVDELGAALARHDLPPSCLTLSIREAALRGDQGSVVEQVKALKALGVRLAVDSFGGGIVSLGYLVELPIDALRIDRSLVRSLDSSEVAGTLARGVIELGTALGLVSIADGVETNDQLAQLRLVSCQYGEGGRFSPALDAPGFAALLG